MGLSPTIGKPKQHIGCHFCVPNILPWSLGCSSKVFTSSCQPKKKSNLHVPKGMDRFFSEFPTKQWGFQGIPKLPLCHSCCCKHVLNWLQIFVVNRTFRNVESLFVGTDCLTNIQHMWLNFESCFYITDGQKKSINSSDEYILQKRCLNTRLKSLVLLFSNITYAIPTKLILFKRIIVHSTSRRSVVLWHLSSLGWTEQPIFCVESEGCIYYIGSPIITLNPAAIQVENFRCSPR